MGTFMVFEEWFYGWTWIKLLITVVFSRDFTQRWSARFCCWILHDWIRWIRVNPVDSHSATCVWLTGLFLVKTSQRVLSNGWSIPTLSLLFLVSLSYRNPMGISISIEIIKSLGSGYFSKVLRKKSHIRIPSWANNLKRLHKNLTFCAFRYQTGCMANVKKGGNEGHQIQSEIRFNFRSQNDLLFNQWSIICLGFWVRLGNKATKALNFLYRQ